MNIGYTLGQLYGSFLTDFIGITRKDFSNFGKFIIIANIFFTIDCGIDFILK